MVNPPSYQGERIWCSSEFHCRKCVHKYVYRPPPSLSLSLLPHILTQASPDQTTDPVQKYTSLLTLTTSREVGSTAQLAGEITYTEFNINAASVRVKARVSGTPGGVAGIFTYRNDTQESDIEMLTRNPSNRINYSNQPVYYAPPRYGQIPGATVEVDLPGGGVYTDWHVHRLDWIPGLSIFYVDGTKTRESRVNVPVDEARVYLNMWGAASEFTGVMPEGGEARLEVEWIEVVFNGTREGGGGVEGRRMRKRAYAARKCSVVERR